MVKIKVRIEMNWMMKMYVCSCYGHHSQSFTLFITCLDIINQSNDRNMPKDIQCHSHVACKNNNCHILRLNELILKTE